MIIQFAAHIQDDRGVTRGDQRAIGVTSASRDVENKLEVFDGAKTEARR